MKFRFAALAIASAALFVASSSNALAFARVPDTSSTLLLVGSAVAGLALFGRRLKK